MAEPDGSQMAIRGMCSVCWVTKVTNIYTYIHAHTHSHVGILILIAFARQQWLHENTSLLPLYIHCISRYGIIYSDTTG